MSPIPYVQEYFHMYKNNYYFQFGLHVDSECTKIILCCLACMLTSLVPRLSLSFSHFFAHANFIRGKVEGEGEPGTEPCPPMATRSIVHSTALALPSGPCLLH